ncbi:34729_t:CDS:2, partial [Gigaspora margarita]
LLNMNVQKKVRGKAKPEKVKKTINKQKLKNQIRNLKVRITRLKEESTDLVAEIASLEEESTNREYYLAAEITRLKKLNQEGINCNYALANEITCLNKLNQEAESKLMMKFSENQRLVAYYKYVTCKGSMPSNEDFEKLRLIFSKLEKETLQEKYLLGCAKSHFLKIKLQNGFLQYLLLATLLFVCYLINDLSKIESAQEVLNEYITEDEFIYVIYYVEKSVNKVNVVVNETNIAVNEPNVTVNETNVAANGNNNFQKQLKVENRLPKAKTKIFS